MTTRFQLVILDETHLILTTEEQLSRQNVEGAQEAFRRWKESGGALIIANCSTIDRQPVFIELELDADNADNADMSPELPGDVAQGTDTQPRGLLRADSEESPSSTLDRHSVESAVVQRRRSRWQIGKH